MEDAQDLARLTTFQHHIDDMRNLVMCKICLKPLYEPFILSCGHTYCYGCLRSWFKGLDSKRRKKNCPDCRNEVTLTPSPNYILRDLVHMFIGRAELLPEDETVDEHVAGKITEAELLASDRDGRGVFDGMFKFSLPLAGFGTIRDDEDGILRCPLCFHEVVEGFCTHCDYTTEDHDPDFSDDDGDSITIDEDSIASEDRSNGSDYDIEYQLPRHFYAQRGPPGADEIDQSIGTDGFSEPEYGTPHQYEHDEDEEDMDGFIDDQVDEPDEVDEDDALDFPPPSWARSRGRGRPYQILDDDEDEDDLESLDEDEVELANFQRNYRQNNWHPGGPIESAEEDSEEDANDHEQMTNYDESDDGSRSATPIAIPITQRRRPIVISDSDDEDEEGDEDDDDVEEEGASDSTGGENLGPGTYEEDASSESSASDSDETTTTPPPQSSASRRQRLDGIRKRRRTPESRTQPAFSRRW